MSALEVLARQIERATPSAFGLNKRHVLFGSADSEAAADQISEFVGRELKASIRDLLIVRIASAGAFGFGLSDGRKVFLKIHAGELAVGQLHALHDSQEMLRQQGVPAARRILSARLFGENCLASVHEFRDRGDRGRAGNSQCVDAAAAMLARIVTTSRQLGDVASLPHILDEEKHPFAIAVPGVTPPKMPSAARALDIYKAIEERARGVLGPTVVGHNDWSARNMRFRGAEVSSLFDFEALRRGPEPLLVGHAAIRFINEESGVPDPMGAAVRFIESYERAAGRRFEDAAAIDLDTGVALESARFCHAAVRSSEFSDEEAPQIFDTIMRRFRQRFGRIDAPVVAVR